MRVALRESGEDVEGEVSAVSSLFDKMKSGGGGKKGVKFGNLQDQGRRGSGNLLELPGGLYLRRSNLYLVDKEIFAETHQTA